jgi:hypothetical protein
MLRLPRSAGVVALAFALAAVAPSARSATVETYGAGTGQDVVLLSGPITPGDADRLTKLAEAAVQAGRPVPSLSLNSQGGLFLEGIRLAETVRRFGLVTYVEEGAQCASACFLVFVAGKEKIASYSARIGVHSVHWVEEATGDAVQADADTEAMGVLLRVLGVSAPIIKKMSETPPERVAWLSAPDLHAMNVKPLGFSDNAPLDLALSAVADRGPHSSLPEPERSWLWDRLVRAASRLSVRQNHGRATIVNVCAPQAASCTSSVSYTDKSGRTGILRTTRDRSGRVISREVCERAADAQPCRPWERSA